MSTERAASQRALTSVYLTLGAGLLFTYYTSASLPDVVASHFNRSGLATGFMPRRIYTTLAMLMLLLPPLLLVLLPRRSLRNPNARINLPNSVYWLAPQRREETLALIAARCTQFAQMFMMFLCYVHWLLVRANHAVPPTCLRAGFWPDWYSFWD